MKLEEIVLDVASRGYQIPVAEADDELLLALKVWLKGEAERDIHAEPVIKIQRVLDFLDR